MLIAGNWKLNPQSLHKAKKLFSGINKKVSGVEVLICPPFVYLSELNKNSKIKLGAQDCFWEEKGAFTGEVSVSMLKNLGCKYVLLGHSERRKYFKESNVWVNKKMKAVLEKDLTPILCIGETKEEKKNGKTQRVIKFQLEKAFKGVLRDQVKKIVIAYEPIWAIGTGKACKPLEAQVINILIKKVVAGLYNRNVAKDVRVLYGGSVKADNAIGYLKEAKFSGLLIGGASLKPKEFVKIIKDTLT